MPLLGLAFLTSLLLAVTDVLVIVGVGALVDLLAQSAPDRLIAQHGLLLAAVGCALLIVQPGLTFLNELLIKKWIVPSLTGHVIWRAHLYTLGHSIGYFRDNLVGRVADRVVQFGPALCDQTVLGIDALLYGVVFAAMATAAFTTINPWLFVPFLAWLIGYALLTRYYLPRMRYRAAQVAQARSGLLGCIVDSYTNIALVKLFARDDLERSFAQNAIGTYTDETRSNLALHVSHATILAAMNTSLLVAIGILSVMFWSLGTITLGEIAAGLALILRLSGISIWFLHVARGFYENLGTIRDSMETIALPHSVIDRPGAKPIHVRRGEIQFENVVFSYSRDGRVIGPINLTVGAGEKIGLIGPSGAGKSTLVSLLLRLYDVDAGRILIDGQDIAECRQGSLREQIGVVPQDASLLHRTIRDNIAYGRRGASDRDIAEALHLARADGFIRLLRDENGRSGLDYPAGTRGEKISGGERQRIAIARALLKNAPVLLLDEATSSVDSDVESAILSAIDELMHGRTVIAIAHRLSTLRAMDRLIVMSEGRIIEEGTHDELLARGTTYAQLWARQVV